MLAKTKKQFEAYFRSIDLVEIRRQERRYKTGRFSIDYPMRREAWNNLIDYLLKDNQLPVRAEDWISPW